MTLLAYRKALIDRLTAVAGDCAMTEAEQMLLAVLARPRSFLFAHPEFIPDDGTLAQIEAMVLRRISGEPLQYILGTAPFMGLEFTVRPGVLIPRRDTEILVEAALPYCEGQRVLDVCTGSGCIGLSVAKLGNPACVALTDLSPDALAIARENALRLGARVDFYQGDFLSAVPDGVQFDVVLSNPPYITVAEMESLPADVRDHEPKLALEAGEDGLNAYRAILPQIDRVLVPGGRLFFEIGYKQGTAVKMLMEAHGFTNVSIIKDYGGLDRVVSGKL